MEATSCLSAWKVPSPPGGRRGSEKGGGTTVRWGVGNPGGSGEKKFPWSGVPSRLLPFLPFAPGVAQRVLGIIGLAVRAALADVPKGEGMRKWTKAGWVVVLVLGCAHSQWPPPQADSPYRIGREDVLEVSVWRDAELSRTLVVRPDGKVSLPLAGEIRAVGRTPGELATEIQDSLAPYVLDPKVVVIVREVNSSRIFVTGEVVRPGAYPLRGKVSLLQALALAGGFSAFADTDAILIIRPGEAPGRIAVRYRDLIANEDPPEVTLLAGDTVVVR